MATPKMKTITRKDWDKKHKDFKLIGKDKKPYIMVYDNGTKLVPVKIIEGDIDEGIASSIDLIRQDSKDVRDFVKKVFSNSDFRDLKNDKDFVKYLKSIYEGVSVNEGRSINAISKLQQKNIDDIAKALDFYKKNKTTDKKEAFVKVLKKLGDEKKKLAKELDDKVGGMYKDAEYKGESVVNESSKGKKIKVYKKYDKVPFTAHLKNLIPNGKPNQYVATDLMGNDIEVEFGLGLGTGQKDPVYMYAGKYTTEGEIKENDKNDYANSEEDFTDEMVVEKIKDIIKYHELDPQDLIDEIRIEFGIDAMD